MRVRGLFLWTLLGSLVFSGPLLWAAERPVTRRGILSGVNVEAGRVELTRRGGEKLTIKVTKETRILINDEPGSLGELKAGERVQMSLLRVKGQWVARWIRDAQTLAVREAEREGVKARIEKVEAGKGIIVVRTVQGKERELHLTTEGRFRSRILRNGKPAKLEEFRVGEEVMVGIRRTGGETLYLKALADELSYLAYLRRRTVSGTVERVDKEKRVLRLAQMGGEPVSVAWTRVTRFYRGGKKEKEQPFGVGDSLVVVVSRRVGGIYRARAMFDKDSWRVYAEAEKAVLEKGKGEGGEG